MSSALFLKALQDMARVEPGSRHSHEFASPRPYESSLARLFKLASHRLAFILLLALNILVLPGCVTRGDVPDVMLPYPVVRKTVLAHLPGGLKSQSPNGRELKSNYFSAKGIDEKLDEEDLYTAIERAYAEVVILGASRPYQIMVKVIREKRTRGSRAYQVLGVDKRLTKELQDRLSQALADRREGGNSIDEFRAF